MYILIGFFDVFMKGNTMLSESYGYKILIAIARLR